jgi:1-phosphofructokinase family hexose kinase
MKIVTLTLSAAYDVHASADALALDHENLVEITDEDAGGKGVNISRALVGVGAASTAVVVLGTENGERFEKMLQADEISYIPIRTDGRIRENLTVHTADGNETRISFKGTSAPPDLMDKVAEICERICDTDTVLTLTGRVPDGISLASVCAFVKQIKQKGTRVVVDSRSFALGDLIECGPFLIKPNSEEICTYMKREVKNADDALIAARELCECGIENVMISLGKDGAVLVNSDGAWHVNAPDAEVVSTIGAGDSAIAGFLFALSRGEDWLTCLKYSVAFGSAACMTSGTRPPIAADIYRLIRS